MTKLKSNPVRQIKLNPAQLMFIMNFSKFGTSIWGRATGKSFIIAFIMHMVVKYMPRSTWGIVGRTFTIMMEITLLPTFYALEQFGYKRDVHYVVRKAPSKDLKFDIPLKPPGDYTHTITFYNGTTFQLISQDRSGRGSDIQGVICDESLNLNKERFDTEVLPAIRGFKEEFGKIPFYRGIYHFTSMPDISGGKWLLDHGNYYKESGIDNDVLLKKMIKLQLAFIDAPSNKLRKEIWPEVKELRKKISFFRSKTGMFYSEANAFDNLNNIGLEYLIERRKAMDDLLFRAEILNEKTGSVLNGFYCNLDERHLYDNYDYDYIDKLGFNRASFESKDCREDKHLDKHRPLHLGIDLGIHINVAVVAQNLHTEIRFLKDFYAKSPLLLKHLIQQFVRYYEPHLKKVVKISYDTGSNSSQQYDNNKSLIANVADDLKKAGWQVEILTKGRKLNHQERYDLINEMYLQDLVPEEKRKYPLLSYHRYNCHNLLIALGNTSVKRGRNIFEKNKAGERNMSADQLHEPHLTDAHDYLIDDLMKDLYKKKNYAGLGLFYTNK